MCNVACIIHYIIYITFFIFYIIYFIQFSFHTFFAFLHLFEADVEKNVKGETFQNYHECMAFVEDLFAFCSFLQFFCVCLYQRFGRSQRWEKEMQYEMLLTLQLDSSKKAYTTRPRKTLAVAPDVETCMAPGVDNNYGKVLQKGGQINRK